MNNVQLRRLDFNLLLIFASVMRHQQVSAAADELGLTKSAVSHALGRLREIFHDELFMRRQTGVEMTPRALTLAPKIVKIIDMSSDAFMIDGSFDPARDKRTFRFGTVEYGAMLFGPVLAETLQREAPNMKLSISILRRAQLLEQIASYSLDLAFGSFYGGTGDLVSEVLFDDVYVVVGRRTNPALQSPLTRSVYVRAEHIMVMGETHPPVILESAFATLGLTRNIVLTVPLYMAAFAAAARSDRLLTVHRRLALEYADAFNLAVRALPFSPVQAAATLISHPSAEHDPGVKWFREKVRAAAAALVSRSGADDTPRRPRRLTSTQKP